MFSTDHLTATLEDWATLIGDKASLGAEDTGRELWPVIAQDGAHYFLNAWAPGATCPWPMKLASCGGCRNKGSG